MRSPQFILFKAMLELLMNQNDVFDAQFSIYLDDAEMIDAVRIAQKHSLFKIIIKDNKLTIVKVWE